jgi:LAO/AO transport system kinase
MERLSVNPNAFIRPSPSKGTLGGVAEKTREAILLCEAAGFDVVMVETVGVGQSETTVASMTDLFVLMQLPNAGDDLQAIKKGVMELADLVVINKADLDPGAATRAEAQITSALRLYGFHGNPAHAHHSNFGMDDSNGERAKGVAIPTSALNEATRKLANTKVMQISALLDRGIELFWQTIKAHQLARQSSSQWLARRRAQEISFVWERVEGELKRSFDEHPNVQKILPSIMSSVNAGVLAPSLAARRLISAYTGEGN